MMRDQLAAALKDAMKSKDAPRLSTIRLIQSEIKTRDIANRGAGKGDASDDEILQIMAKMVKQREESAKIYEDNARPELAAKERAEIVVVQDFMPKQLSEADVRANVAAAITEAGASGLKDMGKVMAVLKERYAGQMDFAKASAVLKELLTAA
ncbi:MULTISPECIES: GatB/YqeY domain-containing protein [Pararhizobium]|uniref:GatB/YqeY domain-containing protein n=1 Tax=Pararhizobium TaxID=1612611 RepID=UPI0023E206A1|nr:GatB/YqeY domain-containing protein [Pararhizobium qamdonense]